MTASVLENAGDSLWICEGPRVSFYGFPYPTRCVIVRLGDGGLWIWSPVALSPALEEALAELGPVRHLISPNAIHHLYLQDWLAVWPDAKVWGPQSSIDKRPDLAFQAPLTDTPPPAWLGEIDQAWFRGSPLMDEVVFFHRRSSTAILADLSENFSDEFLRRHWRPWQRVIARLWKMVEGYGYAPLEWRLSWIRRAPARQALRKMLGWNPQRVIMAHGTWQASGGRAYLQRAFSWLESGLSPR